MRTWVPCCRVGRCDEPAAGVCTLSTTTTAPRSSPTPGCLRIYTSSKRNCKLGEMCGDTDRLLMTCLCSDRLLMTCLCGDRLVMTCLCGDRLVVNCLCGDRLLVTCLCGDRLLIILVTCLCGDRLLMTCLCGGRRTGNKENEMPLHQKHKRDLVQKMKILRQEFQPLQPQTGHCRLEVSREEIFEVIASVSVIPTAPHS